MRTAAIAAGLFLSMTGSCFAQKSSATIDRFETQIPPQALESALKEFEELDHVHVLYLKRDVQNAKTLGASGILTAKETLASLLRGTGLKYCYVDANSVSVIADSKGGTSAGGRSTTGDLSRAAHPLRRSTGAPARSNAEPNGTDPLTKVSKESAGSHKEVTLREVIVTGTHIAGIAPISPVVTVTSEDIRASGLPDIGSVLGSLPEDFSGGQNPAVIQGGGINFGSSETGISTANLRGVGAGATLTLLDGHRLAGNGSLGEVDLSMIPTAAVERIEIDTSGASAIYGADAVAGVVNIVLRKSFDGARTDAYVGGTNDGGLVQRYSQLIGQTYNQGRSGIMAGYEFQSEDEILSRQREVSRTPTIGNPYTLQPQVQKQAIFLSARHNSGLFNLHLEGIYNHRENLQIFDTVYQQAYENQFALNGGVDFAIDDLRSLSVNVTGSGDRDSYLEYDPTYSLPPFGEEWYQNGRFEVSVDEQGTLVELPGNRIIRSAFGIGYSRERFDGELENNMPPAVMSDRHKEHAYAELNVPIFPASDVRPGLERLIFGAAGRFEHFSDFGSVTVPKLSLTYSPVRDWIISGSWGKSFQAPTLSDLYYDELLTRFPGSFFLGVLPNRQVLLVSGANPALRPERATTKDVSIQFSQRNDRRSIGASVSYFDIDFSGRINPPITNFAAAVSNPLFSPFVVRNPSAARQEALASGAVTSLNPFGLPLDPTAVAAIVFDNNQNVSRQVIHGIDVKASLSRETRLGRVTVAGSGTWERFDQQALPGAGLQQIEGTIFNPPSFKARGSLGWADGNFGITLYINHVAGEADNAAAPITPVAAWTTVDSQLRYTTARVELDLSAQNLLNRAPPSASAPNGLGFDADNYSAVGRFLSLEGSIKW